MMKSVGILHPGQMGTSIAASVKNGGYDVYWASEGRSTQSRARAEENGLADAGTLQQLSDVCDTLISVCPPAAAEDVARSVVECGFQGLYVDANAIAPQRAIRMSTTMQDAGISFVDGSIVGPPAWKSNTTFLYLSGTEAEYAAKLFDAGPAHAIVMDGEIGHASALKMCYAAYTKGSTALLTAVLGASEALGVRDALYEQWRKDGMRLETNAPQRAQRVTAKAWRFTGEMDEIAATFEDAGLPGGFHRAAGDIYDRLASFKEADELPAIEDVLQALLKRPAS